MSRTTSSISNGTYALLTAAFITAIASVGISLVHNALSRREKTEKDGRGNAKESRRETVTSVNGNSVKIRRRETLEDEMEASGGTLTVKPIGYVRSVYRLCVGTPRQGLLAPNARGRIELITSITEDAVQGLEGYSHIWIVFVFHLNTKSKSKQSSSKISPPALGGEKVGVLATRSPHRFNPIGITLAKLDRIHTIKKYTSENKKKKPSLITVLEISGLDLVDGTPVLDVKPYVHNYDSIPDNMHQYTVPTWVADGLATKRNVYITDIAKQQLHDIMFQIPNSLEFYHGDTAYDDVLACIEQVLAIDVRSNFQTQKARNGQFQAERAKRLGMNGNDDNVDNKTDKDEHHEVQYCTQVIDKLLISYNVQESIILERSASLGSGAEDTVVVHSIRYFS